MVTGMLDGVGRNSKRKGMAFSLDALVAFMLLFSVVLLFSLSESNVFSSEIIQEGFHDNAQSAVALLSKLRLNDVQREPAVAELFDQGFFTQDQTDMTVMQALGMLWATNDSANLSAAANLSKALLEPVMPGGVQWAVTLEGDVMYNTTAAPASKSIASSKRLVSGVAQELPATGCVARAFIKKIRGKHEKAYAFFGGFVGEGNLSAVVRGIEEDAGIQGIRLELNAGDNFSLYVNGFYCDWFQKTPGNYSVDEWVVTNQSCLERVTPGQDNEFQINFTGNELTRKHVGGGFIEVTYNTTRMTPPRTTTQRVYLNGIDGFINYYSSFYVPGQINLVSASLHFLNNHTTTFKVGNRTLMNNSGSEEAQTVDIPNYNFTQEFPNYAELSQRNVPVRLYVQANGTVNVTDRDVFLIVDVSESMKYMINGSTYLGSTPAFCNDSSNYSNSTQRLWLAKCIVSDFVDKILSNPGSRVALVPFNTSTTSAVDLTNNSALLKANINSYSPDGRKCICCGVNKVRQMLAVVANQNRTSVAILLTDGITNETDIMRCTNVNNCPPNEADCLPNSPRCFTGNLTDVSEGWRCCERGGDRPCTSSRCNASSQNVIYSSCELKRSFPNATIHAVGFATTPHCQMDNMTLSKAAACGGGAFFLSTNASLLAEFYENLTRQLIIPTGTQVVEVVGTANSTLYHDSWLDFSFTPATPEYGYQELSITKENPVFASCEGSVFIPQQMTVDEFQVTSYSGAYWTDNVSLLNSGTGGWSTEFNLSEYGSNYNFLGDPFFIQFNVSRIKSGEYNNVSIRTGNAPGNASSECSQNNRAVYKARLVAAVNYSSVFVECMARNVSIYYDNDFDGVADGFVNVTIGEGLPSAGEEYVPVEELETQRNGVDDALQRLLNKLNFVSGTGDEGPSGSITNPVDIELSEDVGSSALTGQGIPFLWGPAEVKVMVWT